MKTTDGKTKGKVWIYENDVRETLKINKRIRDDFNKLCKEKKIIKSRLVEEVYKSILIRFRDGSLNATDGYLTLNILRAPIVRVAD